MIDRRWLYGTKAYHVVGMDRMLDGGFVAKVSSRKPRPNQLTTFLRCGWPIKNAFFLSWSSQESWDLLTHRAGKPINVQFANRKPHKTNKMALHVTL